VTHEGEAARPPSRTTRENDLEKQIAVIFCCTFQSVEHAEDRVRASSFGLALIAAGIAGVILGIVGAHTGNPTTGEQEWYWLAIAISLVPLVVGFLLFRRS
jgi:hypothetical protein